MLELELELDPSNKDISMFEACDLYIWEIIIVALDVCIMPTCLQCLSTI